MGVLSKKKKTKKNYSEKKMFFKAKFLNMPRSIQKMALAVPIFSEGFDFCVVKCCKAAGEISSFG